MKRATNRLILSGLAIVTLLIVNSCSTTRIGRLDGQWQLFYLDRPEDKSIYIWEFAEGNVFTITKFDPPTPTNPNPVPSTICRAEYESKAEFIDAAIQISNVSVAEGAAFQQLSMIDRQTYNVRWKILKVDNEVMRLGSDDINQHNGGVGYVVREFSRVN